MHPQRFPKTPWLYDVRDITPQGDAETVVFLPNREALEGLYIRGLDWFIGEDMMLGVRVTETGNPISCAITTDIAIDYAPMRVCRAQADGDDGA